MFAQDTVLPGLGQDQSAIPGIWAQICFCALQARGLGGLLPSVADGFERDRGIYTFLDSSQKNNRLGQPMSNRPWYSAGMKNMRNRSHRDLIRVGLDPKLSSPEMLFHWLARPRNPVMASNDPLANMFIEAMLANEPVEFIYVGGSKPGSPRRVNVSLVFRHEPNGRIYVAGYCPERKANRMFALDLVMVLCAGI
jgi:hypothetical protein